MKALKNWLKKFSFYKELRHIYRATVLYRKPVSYFYNRFLVKGQIRNRKQPLDRVETDPSYSIHLLCGHSDLDMLLWSLASWYRVVPQSGEVFIHEDGSFTADDRLVISSFLPQAKVVDYQWAGEQAVINWLKDFPAARSFREAHKKYIFAIKLIDPYFVSEKPRRLILDTDVLWFSKPLEILNLLARDKFTFFLGGNREMDYQFVDNTILPKEVASANSGIVGYDRDGYKLSVLEDFCRKNGADNPSRVIEQAGYAYLLNQQRRIDFLDKSQYLIKGRVGERTVAKHYTGPRREEYWLEGVEILRRRILNS